ncbi:choline/Carnitine o-acyltransferase domain-containing protein [Ditylenchus destructor]|nr:choline/Carnitine o-acyltransferase domain-containing protein [Ditylenchus destructor]
MAEAHNVAGLSIALTHDGVSVTYDQELLRDIWHNFNRGSRRRIYRFKNDFFAGIFPANIQSLIFVDSLVTGLYFFDKDPTFGAINLLKNYFFYYLFGDGVLSKSLAAVTTGGLLWFGLVQIFRVSLKGLLSYKGWMYENPHTTGKISATTKLWFQIMRIISKSGPMLHSFQGALPRLPLPSLDETLNRHLRSIRPITSDEEYNEMVDLTEKFRKGLGRRLQRFLFIKSLFSINYVTDWWEEFVYLRQRSPIMINSNYYGFDTLNENPTTNQAARAANVTWGALLFRRLIERQEFAVSSRINVPFCTMQYSRLFNSCRVPGEETDSFRVWNDAKHVAVYAKGCWYKLSIHNGKRLLEPAELQVAFQEILDSSEEPAPGEKELAALTAGERVHWAVTRRKYFGSGVNKSSLHAIERAAFVVILDEDEVFYDPNDPSKLDKWAENLLHGKAYNRWFDKSFNFIISANGRFGINTEHSWGDAAVTAHFVEYVLLKDYCVRGYDDNGNCKGEANVVMHPERLKWSLDQDIKDKIDTSLEVAQKLINDVEMALLVWTDYGKGFIKKLKISPDAFIQMTLQLTWFRNQNHFALTYEASMTRLFREGRTETVRSCTVESCDFVRAMLDDTKTREDRLRLLRMAADRHQQLYRDAMCGQGVDRHLFALYVVQRYLEEESQLMNKVMPPTYLLSTSQTPLNQCEEEAKNLSPQQRLSLVSAGGGFGPVADRGYGVSYIIAGEDQISFHISSKKSADNTSSQLFRECLKESLMMMKSLFAKE